MNYSNKSVFIEVSLNHGSCAVCRVQSVCAFVFIWNLCLVCRRTGILFASPSHSLNLFGVNSSSFKLVIIFVFHFVVSFFLYFFRVVHVPNGSTAGLKSQSRVMNQRGIVCEENEKSWCERQIIINNKRSVLSRLRTYCAKISIYVHINEKKSTAPSECWLFDNDEPRSD